MAPTTKYWIGVLHTILFLIVGLKADAYTGSWPPPSTTTDTVAVVPISATASASPASITLNFPRPGAYQIFRKDPQDGVNVSGSSNPWGTALTTLAPGSTTWTDSSVNVGQLYEYKAVCTDGISEEQVPNPITYVSGSAPPVGYVLTGINVDETQPRGRVVLVVATDVQTNLPNEYAQYVADLVADGWFVHVIPVPRAVSTFVTGTTTTAGATYEVTGSNALSTVTVTSPGSGYVTGTGGTVDHTGNICLANSSGSSIATGTITIGANGTITAMKVVYPGGGFTPGDTLTPVYLAGSATGLVSGTTSPFTSGSGATFAVGSVTSGSTNPIPIRNQIMAIYNQYPGQVKNVILLGKVPACRTGAGEFWDPDGHGVQLACYGADGYYANMTGTWTDAASDYYYFANWGGNNGYSISQGTLNLPGDNKFDQYYMSQTGGAADMGFGRIDLSNGIAGEYPALQAYLQKLHRYKVADPSFQPGRRICMRGNGFAQVDETGWECALNITGSPANIDLVPLTSLPNVSVMDADAVYSAQHGPYLFYFKGANYPGYGVGGEAVIWTGMQSHWGWWFSTSTTSNENDMALRLGENSYTLSFTWDIFGTRYFYHRMGMGFDTGDMMRVSINNYDGINGTYAWVTDANSSDPYISPCSGGLFMNHFGDPTLRLFMFPPPTNLSVVGTSGHPILTWTASGAMNDPNEPSVIGYHVYRAPLSSGTLTGPATRVTLTLVSGTTYTDATVGTGSGQWSYMVRAVRLETTGGGTFYNASLGASQSVDMTNAPAPLQIASSGTLPSANWNNAYTSALAVQGGTPAYTWSLVSGTLPPGLTLNSNGTFSGSPTAAGGYTFTAKVTDALGLSVPQTFTITAQSNNTITLLPEASSYVISASPTRNQGASETMIVSGTTNISLLRFNLAGLNLNNSFVSATLQLYPGLGTTANCYALVGAALTADNATGWNVVNSITTNITGAANNGSGHFRITSPNHGLNPLFGNTTTIARVTGSNSSLANTTLTVSVIDQNTFDLPTLAYNAGMVWTNAISSPINGIIYNTLPANNSSVPPVYATTYPVINNYLTMDVTSLLQAALTGTSGKMSLRLFTPSTQTVYLCSAYSYANAIPQLIIQTTNAPAIAIASPSINPAFIYQNSGLRITATATAILANAANLTTQWTQLSGPGTATFSSPSLPSTTVTFSAPGDYVLQLSANDGVLQSSKTVTVRVLSVPTGTVPVTGPTMNLVLRMPLDETSGTIAHDYSGVSPANSGTLAYVSGTSSPVWSPSGGKIGGALLFSGSGQQAIVPDSVNLDGMQQMSISLWMYANSINTNSSNYNALVTKRATGGAKVSYTIAIRGGRDRGITSGMTSEMGRNTATHRLRLAHGIMS